MHTWSQKSSFENSVHRYMQKNSWKYCTTLYLKTWFYLLQAQDTLETDAGEPVSCDNIELLKEVLDDIDIYAGRNPRVKELRKILTNSHFKVKWKYLIIFSSCLSDNHIKLMCNITRLTRLYACILNIKILWLAARSYLTNMTRKGAARNQLSRHI